MATLYKSNKLNMSLTYDDWYLYLTDIDITGKMALNFKTYWPILVKHLEIEEAQPCGSY